MAQTTTINGTAPRSRARQQLLLGALGVVYGDIGTSPLYAVKQCFNELGGLTPMAVYGVLSLITWALTIIVTLKYVTVILRADNRGEGGILALTALALRASDGKGRLHWWILAAGLLGASLFYGDGVITPAISVLSAVEGLKVATPFFDPYVIPITVALLLMLFLFQRRGTALVGGFFGPVMVIWFLTIGVLGLIEIVRQPEHPESDQSLLRHCPAHRRSGQGLRAARGGGAGGDGGRSALRRPRTFRPSPHPHGLAQLRLPGAAPQLFRPGGAPLEVARRSRTRSIGSRPTGRSIRSWCWPRRPPSSPRKPSGR